MKSKDIELNPDLPAFERRRQNYLDRINGLSKPNQEAILDFHNQHNLIQCNVNGQIRNLTCLLKLVEVHKFDLSNLSEPDLQKLNTYWLENHTKETRNREINTVKVFLRHLLAKNGLPRKEKEKIEFLIKSKLLKKTDSRKDMASKIQATDLLTEKEATLLIQHSNTKYKALWATLWGSSCRISALRFLRRKDLSFEPDGSVVINITSKGQINSIWIRDDLGLLLKKWLEESPHKKPESFVFPTEEGNCLSENAILKSLKLAGKKAEIKKRLFPHLFRHSSIAALLNGGFNPVFLKKRAWGNESSTMLEKVYGHLNTASINQAMKTFVGQDKAPEPPKFEMAKKICFNCGKENAFNAEFCACGLSLDAKKAQEEHYWRELEKKEMETRMKTLEWKLETVLQEIKNKK